MNLRGIVSVSGRPGLFKVIGQNKSGFVLESLDGQKLKLVVNISTSKLASLEDITIFGEDDDLKLSDILEKMKSMEVPDPKKADGTALRNFFRETAPGHDEEKVYASDIKKIVSWFNILRGTPMFDEPAETERPEQAEAVEVVEAVEETASESAPAEAETKKAKAPRRKKG